MGFFVGSLMADQKFPLRRHIRGQWVKQIGGKVRYFGTDKTKALERYHALVAELEGIETPITLADLVNHFLTHHDVRARSGEISEHTFRTYHDACHTLVEYFGRGKVYSRIQPHEFTEYKKWLGETYRLATVCAKVMVTRCVYRFAERNKFMPTGLVQFGELKAPDRRVLRKQRDAGRRRVFTPVELRHLLVAAREPARTMLLLGINCSWRKRHGAAPR